MTDDVIDIQVMIEPEETEESGLLLLVDDNPTNIDVLYEYLTDAGYEVLVAEDGQSALDRIELVTPDLVLLDIMMPKMDGFEVCRRLKEREDTREVPVIFITAMGSTEDKVKGFSLGAVDYITKPFQNQEVLARIRTQLSMKLMQRKLGEKNLQLLEQNHALNAYARTVAHDLKNPLNLILNFARLLQEEAGLEETAAQDLNTIIQSADRMNHIIQDLLLLAQLRKDEVKPVEVDMALAVQQSLDRLHVTLEEEGAEIDTPDEWIDAMGVSSWIQAVWVNYISNAIKYGGEPAQIRLRCEQKEDGMVLYGVEDNGEGISKDEFDTVFDEFTRLGGEKSSGHGIGLSIVKRIVGRLGGEVGVENLDGSGGCFFFFTLPGVSEV